MKNVESDLHLEDFFTKTISKSIEKTITPSLVTLIEKTIRKLEIRLI